MVFIALSIPLTTFAMLPVTCLMVTAVCTLLATASILEARRRRFRRSFCFLMAFCAYIFAISWFPCERAYFNRVSGPAVLPAAREQKRVRSKEQMGREKKKRQKQKKKREWEKKRKKKSSRVHVCMYVCKGAVRVQQRRVGQCSRVGKG